MEALRGKSVADLPLIDWEEAASYVNGGEKDEPFLVELLTCFYSESHPRLHNVMAAALAYRRGETHFNGKPIETVAREEAHALKGSAANVRLFRITKAAENCELPIKAICPPQAAPESVDAVAKRALLDRLCFNPDEQIGVLVVQFRAFVAFMEGEAREKVAAADIAEAARAEALAQLDSVSSSELEARLADVADFWVPGTPASAADPGRCVAAAEVTASEPAAAGVSATGNKPAVPASEPSDGTALPATSSLAGSLNDDQPTAASAFVAPLPPQQQRYLKPSPPAKSESGISVLTPASAGGADGAGPGGSIGSATAQSDVATGSSGSQAAAQSQSQCCSIS